jgi:hypothetical protein
MASVESASSSSLVTLVQRLGAIPFIVALILGARHALGASASFMLFGFLLAPALSYVHVGADRDGVDLQWLWLQHKIPWSSIRSVEHKAEFMGGRLSIVLQDSETLRLRSFVSLGWVEDQAKHRAQNVGHEPSHAVALPWWLTRLRPVSGPPRE